MKKVFKNKVILGIILGIIFFLILISLILILNNKSLNEKGSIQENEPINDKNNNELEEFKVTFNSNGGSALKSVIVKKGELLTKPAPPTRKGYIFEKWILNNQEFDFNSPINENIILVASWTKENNTSSNSNSSNNSNKNSTESTINKINLNDYISVTINFANYSRPSGYYFITNLKDIFPSLGDKKSITVGFDDETSEDFDIKYSEWMEALNKFQFDSNKENSAKSKLEQLKKSKGIKFEILNGPNGDNHFLGYKYEYLTISNTSYNNLKNDLKKIKTDLDTTLNNLFKDAIYVILPGYGVYPTYDELLDEKICQEYNLICDRW